MRVLVASNMQPAAGARHRGSFVREQVEALRELGVDVELFEFAPGVGNIPAAIRRLRALVRTGRFDLVHAHYGITGWCALRAGARPLVTTFHGTDVRHPLTGRLSRSIRRRLDLVALASKALSAPENGRPPLRRVAGRTAVLPCGANFERFAPVPRAEARAALGLDPSQPCLFLPADPARPVKRADRARQVADAAGARLLTAGGIEPEQMAVHINAADAVLIPSDNEGFGLAAVEAMACETPVIARPVGAVPVIAAGAPACLVAEFDAKAWAEHARKLAIGSRPDGLRERAAWLSRERMAARVERAYSEVLERTRTPA